MSKINIDRFNTKQIAIMNDAISKGLEPKQIEIFMKPEFSSCIMEVLVDGLLKDVPINRLKLCMNPKFNHKQVREVYAGIEDGLLVKQIKSYANPKVHYMDMYKIRRKLCSGEMMTKEVPFYLAVKCNDKKFAVIHEGFDNGLSLEQIWLYSNPKFNVSQMTRIRQGFHVVKLSIEQVELYANPKFNISQMGIIEEGIALNLSIEQVKIYAKTKYNSGQMHNIFVGLKVYELPQEYLSLLTNPRYNEYQGKVVIALIRMGYSIPEIRKIRKLNWDKFTFNEVERFFIKIHYKKTGYNYNQLYEIFRGFESGLSFEAVSEYMNKRISVKEMETMRKKILKQHRYDL